MSRKKCSAATRFVGEFGGSVGKVIAIPTAVYSHSQLILASARRAVGAREISPKYCGNAFSR